MMKKLLIFIGFLFFVLALFFYRPALGVETLKKKYTDETSEFIELNGMMAHYQKKGNGIPLLLIHGTSSSLHTWGKWVEVLSPHFTTYSIDMPGGGLTGPHPDQEYTIDIYLDFLDKFCAQLNLDSIYIAGNSLGGKIAWKYASTRSTVKKLILVDPSGFYTETEETPLVFKLGKNKLLSKLVEGINVGLFINKSLKEVFYDDEKITKELQQRYNHMLRRKGNRKAFFKKVASIESSKESELVNITCPTLIQWGKHDEWLSVDLATIYTKNILDNTLLIYENCGHVPQEEIPEKSANDALLFLLEE